MRVYVLDRDYQTLKAAEQIVGRCPSCEVVCFADVRMLRQAMEEAVPDILLLDAELKNSTPIVELLAESRRATKVILMAVSDAYAAEAFELGAYGYILKPISEEKIRKQLFQIRHPVLSRLELSNDKDK